MPDEEWVTYTQPTRLPWRSYIAKYDHSFAPEPETFDAKDLAITIFDLTALILIIYFAVN
ncbi:hypothetical protein KBD69_05475 [Candidatus Woesebacteria bacterium]|nr:hypothetical protein [Candidatus Woesebacteria bacterium]